MIITDLKKKKEQHKDFAEPVDGAGGNSKCRRAGSLGAVTQGKHLQG